MKGAVRVRGPKQLRAFHTHAHAALPEYVRRPQRQPVSVEAGRRASSNTPFPVLVAGPPMMYSSRQPTYVLPCEKE